jgi:uracil phosphoribosyltransferase
MRDFRALINEIGGLMAYEITRDLPEKEVNVETPICETKAHMLAKEVVIVPILRAGIGMVDGIHNLIPTAKIGHIGMYRDEETLEAHEYYAKFPKEMPESSVLLVDPMIATGGSVIMAIEALKKRGAKDIRLVGLVAAPEGIKAIQELHPDIDIYLAALDEKLNEIGYIVPGLGDCGDRLFGTK